MSYPAIVGFIMMLVIIWILIKQKTSTIFAFTVIPIIAAVILGKGPQDIGNYLTKGFAMTIPVSLIMLFSLPYFMLMADTGLFNGIVRRILKRISLTPIVLTVLTLIVSIIVGFDVSITSIYLIAIPLFLPFYKRLKMDPIILMFISTLGVIDTFDVPWSARMLRSASLLHGVNNGTMVIFQRMLPAQALFTVILFIIAIWLGIKEQKRLKKEYGESFIKEATGKGNIEDIKDDPELGRPNLFWTNVVLTLLVIAALCFLTAVPTYYVFALGLVIALAINYPDLKQQIKVLKKYAASLFPVMPAILLSGVVVGVMQFSGMMKAMVQTLVAIIPASMGPWVYIIVAIFAVPLMFLFTNDTWYYVLLPIVISLMNEYHVSPIVVIATLFFNMGAMLTPIAQPQIYLGIDLTHGAVTFDRYAKYAFLPIWGLSIVLLVLGLLTGSFR